MKTVSHQKVYGRNVTITNFLKNGIVISKFSTLIIFVERNYVVYRPKKSNVFSIDGMYIYLHIFLKEFSEEAYFNVNMGIIHIACRR